MKTHYIILGLLLSTIHLSGQDITGKWYALLDPQGESLRLVLDIEKTKKAYKSVLYSIDQSPEGFEMKKTRFKDSIFTTKALLGLFKFNGKYTDGKLEGIFKQFGQEFPLVFTRQKIEKPIIKRTQDPTLPLPYYTEEVKFHNKKDSITLAGTLSLPDKKGKYPVAILISGSGQQDRNEEVFGHKPFLILSDYLTRNGIAVLRYDDRGTAESTGDFHTATSFDFASDVHSAIDYLKSRPEIDTKKIGLIGHSEGGMIAPLVASTNENVSFIVLIAGPGIPGDKLLLLQDEIIAKAEGEPEKDIQKSKEVSIELFEMVKNSTINKTLKKKLTKRLKLALKNEADSLFEEISKKTYINNIVNELTTPWMAYMLKYKPASVLEKVKCPVLALNGEKDTQVPSKANLTAIQAALENSNNPDVTVHEFPKLNHLMQECKTGLPSEYKDIEQTMSPDVLILITKWIQQRSK